MVDKRRIQKNIKNLQRVKTWQLVILLILMLFVAATFLRLNNTGMIQRRQAVMDADKQGDANVINERLYDLQRYSAAHMNADSGVFYLQETYNRDAEKMVQSMSGSSEYAAVHAAAEAVCHPQFHGWSMAYLNCFVAEVSKHPTSNTLPEVQTPEESLYRYNFVSPRWSPDFAGFSILVALGIIFVILARIISLLVLKLLLKRHYRSV